MAIDIDAEIKNDSLMYSDLFLYFFQQIPNGNVLAKASYDEEMEYQHALITSRSRMNQLTPEVKKEMWDWLDKCHKAAGISTVQEWEWLVYPYPRPDTPTQNTDNGQYDPNKVNSIPQSTATLSMTDDQQQLMAKLQVDNPSANDIVAGKLQLLVAKEHYQYLREMNTLVGRPIDTTDYNQTLAWIDTLQKTMKIASTDILYGSSTLTLTQRMNDLYKTILTTPNETIKSAILLQPEYIHSYALYLRQSSQLFGDTRNNLKTYMNDIHSLLGTSQENWEIDLLGIAESNTVNGTIGELAKGMETVGEQDQDWQNVISEIDAPNVDSLGVAKFHVLRYKEDIYRCEASMKRNGTDRTALTNQEKLDAYRIVKIQGHIDMGGAGALYGSAKLTQAQLLDYFKMYNSWPSGLAEAYKQNIVDTMNYYLDDVEKDVNEYRNAYQSKYHTNEVVYDTSFKKTWWDWMVSIRACVTNNSQTTRVFDIRSFETLLDYSKDTTLPANPTANNLLNALTAEEKASVDADTDFKNYLKIITDNNVQNPSLAKDMATYLILREKEVIYRYNTTIKYETNLPNKNNLLSEQKKSAYKAQLVRQTLTNGPSSSDTLLGTGDLLIPSQLIQYFSYGFNSSISTKLASTEIEKIKVTMGAEIDLVKYFVTTAMSDADKTKCKTLISQIRSISLNSYTQTIRDFEKTLDSSATPGSSVTPVAVNLSTITVDSATYGQASSDMANLLNDLHKLSTETDLEFLHRKRVAYLFVRQQFEAKFTLATIDTTKYTAPSSSDWKYYAAQLQVLMNTQGLSGDAECNLSAWTFQNSINLISYSSLTNDRNKYNQCTTVAQSELGIIKARIDKEYPNFATTGANASDVKSKYKANVDAIYNAYKTTNGLPALDVTDWVTKIRS